MNVQCPTSRLIALAVLCLLACVNDGLAAEPMQYPLAVAVTDDGTIYVADLKLPGIWEIREGTRREYFRGSKKFRTPLNAVRCLAIDQEGRLLAGDSATREIYRFDADAKPQPLTDGKLGIPAALAVDAEGVIYVSDLETRRVWKVAAAGGEPVEVARIAGVRGMAFADDGSLLVATALAPQVRKIAPDGTVTPVVTGRPLKFPQHLAITKTGTIYIADNYSAGLWKLAEDGTPELWKTGKPFLRPVGLTAADDVLYLADPHARSLFRVDQAGKVTLFDGPPAADAGVDSSTGDAAQQRQQSLPGPAVASVLVLLFGIENQQLFLMEPAAAMHGFPLKSQQPQSPRSFARVWLTGCAAVVVYLVASGGTARATCGDYLARSAGSHGRQSAPAAHSGMLAGDSLQHTAASGPRLTGHGNQHLPATPCSSPQCRSRSGQWPAPLPAVLTWPAPVEASLATVAGLPVMALPARSLPLSADAAGLRGYPEQVQRPPECPVV